MSLFLSSGDVEAQERVGHVSFYFRGHQDRKLYFSGGDEHASVILHILKTTLKLIEKSEFNVNELSALFNCVLNLVADKAQRKVVVPNGLDLNAWINDPPSDSEDESITTSSYYDNKDLFYGDNGENYNSNLYSGVTLSYQKSKKYIGLTAEELEKQRESRKQSEQMNPFYLKDSKKPKVTQT
ncbi:unnamed protein product, partial [Rotaria sordida]